MSNMKFTDKERAFTKRFGLVLRGTGTVVKRNSIQCINYEDLDQVIDYNSHVIKEKTIIFEITADDFIFLMHEFDCFKKRLTRYGDVEEYMVQMDKLDHKENLLRKKYPGVAELYEKYQGMLALVQSDNDL